MTTDMLTCADVAERVKAIAALAEYDDEDAHKQEDALYHVVLRAVAAGHPDSVALALAALETKKLSFGRWYA